MSTTATPQVQDFQKGRPSNRGALRFLRSGQVVTGLCLVVVAMLFALLGPLVAPFDPNDSVSAPYGPTGQGYLLGTDSLGRDVLSRVLYGGLHIIWMAPAATALGVAIGAAVGLAAAYYSGVVDAILMRLMDVVLAFPALVFTLLFVSIIGPEPWLLVLLVTIGLIPGVARVIRGTAIPLMSQEYVQWGEAVEVPSRRILVRDVLPNVTSPLFVEFGVRLMISINILASLSFIGYGIQPPTSGWGLMVSENRTGLANQPLAVLAPIVLIIVFTVGGNLIAEGAARVIGRTEGKGGDQ